LLACILDQGLQEFDEFFGIERLINDHPARLALIGDCGDHRELVAGPAHSHGHRSFARWREAPTPHIGKDPRSLIAPVNFSTLGPGALLNGWIFAFKPSLYRRRALFVGALDGLLRREPPSA
ncbi:MAG: family transposase, partial [Polaromonas sp.]|nr:family transposase [Polaromonas sp.]